MQTAFSELVALRGSGALARAEAAADELAPVVEQLCEAWDMLFAARREGDWEAASGWLSSLDGLLKQKGKKGNWAPANPKDTIKTLRGLYEEVPSWLRKGDLALGSPAGGGHACVVQAVCRGGRNLWAIAG